MKSLPTIVAALALGVITCNAEDPAKPAPAPGAPPHAEGDKKPHMSPEEAFKKLDTDNSGDISLAEFKAGPRAQKDPAKAEEHYKKLDADNNGKVTLEEFKAGHHQGGRGEGKGPKPDGPKPE